MVLIGDRPGSLQATTSGLIRRACVSKLHEVELGPDLLPLSRKLSMCSVHTLGPPARSSKHIKTDTLRLSHRSTVTARGRDTRRKPAPLGP